MLVMDSVYSCPSDPENDSQAFISPCRMISLPQTFELQEQVEESTTHWWLSSLRVSKENSMNKLHYRQKRALPQETGWMKLKILDSWTMRNGLDFCPSTFPEKITANVSAQGSTHKTWWKGDQGDQSTQQCSMMHPVEWVLLCLVCLLC